MDLRKANAQGTGGLLEDGQTRGRHGKNGRSNVLLDAINSQGSRNSTRHLVGVLHVGLDRMIDGTARASVDSSAGIAVAVRHLSSITVMSLADKSGTRSGSFSDCILRTCKSGKGCE